MVVSVCFCIKKKQREQVFEKLVKEMMEKVIMLEGCIFVFEMENKWFKLFVMEKYGDKQDIFEKFFKEFVVREVKKGLLFLGIKDSISVVSFIIVVDDLDKLFVKRKD